METLRRPGRFRGTENDSGATTLPVDTAVPHEDHPRRLIELVMAAYDDTVTEPPPGRIFTSELRRVFADMIAGFDHLDDIMKKQNLGVGSSEITPLGRAKLLGR